MVAILFRIAGLANLLIMGVGNLLGFAAFSLKVALFWLSVWGVIIAVWLVPKTWWQDRLVEIITWISQRMNDLGDYLAAGPIAQLDSAISGLGPVIGYAQYYCDIGFGFRVLTGGIGLVALAITIRMVLLGLRTAGVIK